jgi:hypothetical protein
MSKQKNNKALKKIYEGVSVLKIKEKEIKYNLIVCVGDQMDYVRVSQIKTEVEPISLYHALIIPEVIATYKLKPTSTNWVEDLSDMHPHLAYKVPRLITFKLNEKQEVTELNSKNLNAEEDNFGKL